MGAFFIACVVASILVSGWLGIVGLVRGELQFSKDRYISGLGARIAAILCLCFCASFSGLCAWIIMGGLR